MINKTRIVAKCPDCQSDINLPPKPELWMRITCPECGTQLEIVDEDPWELDYAEDFDEDELDSDFENELEEDDFEVALHEDEEGEEEPPWK